MKLTNENENYCATIVRVNHLNQLDGAKTLAGFPIFGMQALISKDTPIGTLGVLFPTECKLSHEFCKNNNLYRDSELNIDTDKSGFFEQNGRVKAVKFFKNISNAFFVELSSLAYLGINVEDLQEGDKFTHINGQEICRKYIIQQTQVKGNKTRGVTKKFTRIDNKTFPEHFDTEQYARNIEKYKDNDWLIITEKIHGTSGRFTHAKVRKLNGVEKFVHSLDARFLHVLNSRPRIKQLKRLKKWLHDKYFYTISSNLNKIPFRKNFEYDTLAGSRRVIKDTKTQKINDDYYDCDIWNMHLEKICHIIPKNWVLYGEIIGWVSPGQAIQKNYTYGLPDGTSELYIYRITIVNEDGVVLDLSWDKIKEWCINNAIKHVPEMWRGYHKDFNYEDYLDKRYHEEGYPQCLPLINKKGIVSEGICIRREGLSPYITKAKSPMFYEHETKQLDSGEVDIESSQGEV